MKDPVWRAISYGNWAKSLRPSENPLTIIAETVYYLSMQKRLIATIHGRVQGVAFRYHAKKHADQLGVRGWVRNGRDGTVETIAEGDATQLDLFLQWLQMGSPSATVTKVDPVWSEATGEFRRFSIKWL
jgi:acylphosphatase